MRKALFFAISLLIIPLAAQQASGALSQIVVLYHRLEQQ